MSKAQNIVLEGYGKGYKLKNDLRNHVYFNPSKYEGVLLTKDNIASYEVITEDTVKSGSSAILRGVVGTALLGGVGILAGLSAKNKSTHVVAVEWKNGEKSLLELDQYDYKVLVKSMF